MPDPSQMTRRSILKGGPLLGAAALCAGSAEADENGAAAKKDCRHVELKDTPHIRTYYARARS